MVHRVRFIAAALLLLAASSASAQTFPNRTIHIIVAYAPGGTGDIVARLIAPPLGEALGQNVVVENRAGATGALGTQAVVSAPADGHTLLLGQTGEIAINQHWLKGLSYDAGKDLAPVALASVVPLALVVAAKAPYSTMAELGKALAEKTPLSFASAGTGTPGHFAGEFLKLRTKANLTHVPYKGAGPALNDLLGGQIDGVCDNAASIAPSIQGGLANGVAVAMPSRLRGLPNVPTTIEAGLPEFQLQGWNGLFAPKGTAQPVIDKLNAALRKGVASDAYRSRLDELGSLPPTDEEMSPGYLQQFVPREVEKFRKLLAENK